MKAAASIPFGRGRPLIDDPVEDASPVEMLIQARRALIAIGGGPSEQVCVVRRRLFTARWRRGSAERS